MTDKTKKKPGDEDDDAKDAGVSKFGVDDRVPPEEVPMAGGHENHRDPNLGTNVKE